MKTSDLDWSVLRGAIAALVIAVLASGAMIFGAYTYGERMDQAYAAEKRRLDSVRARYRAIDEEARMIREYLPEYRRLRASGVLGAERRLDWIEALRASAASVRVPSLRYEISSQREFRPEFELALGRFGAFESGMRLEVGLLHEGDLLRLLAELERRRHGLYQLRDCRISRGGTEFAMEPGRANLSASCRLRWLTLHEPGEGRS